MTAAGVRKDARALNSTDGPGRTSDPEAAIRVRTLWKRYGSVEAVRGISLDIRPGEIFGLIGPD